MDASKLPQHLDGLSLVPLLSGDKQPAHEYLVTKQLRLPPVPTFVCFSLWELPSSLWLQYWEFCTRHNGNAGWGHAVRSGDWKAVAFFADAPLQL